MKNIIKRFRKIIAPVEMQDKCICFLEFNQGINYIQQELSAAEALTYKPVAEPEQYQLRAVFHFELFEYLI